MSERKIVYVVYFAPDGVPQTSDGVWAGVISVHENEEDAKKAAQYERDSGVWGDFSHTKEGHSDYDENDTSSDRNLWVEIDAVTYFARTPCAHPNLGPNTTQCPDCKAMLGVRPV